MVSLDEQLSPEESALPPAELRFRVAGTEDANWFNQSGAMSVQDLARGLAAIGASLGDFADILDWGCGCGRILRALPTELTTPAHRVYGCDIDKEAIAWVRSNLPWVRASVNDGLPPLAYPNDSFDLIYNHSVMTHLDETYQDAWLSELRRIIRPKGIVTLTVNGLERAREWLRSFPPDSPEPKQIEAALRDQGIFYVYHDSWRGGPFPDFYHSAFHDVRYVFEHWGEYLDVRCYIPSGALNHQDLVVLQRRAE